MTKGRKTTQEERAEIVAFCIEHGKDYGLTVEQEARNALQQETNPQTYADIAFKVCMS